MKKQNNDKQLNKMTRKEAFRKFLKIKGRYSFLYATCSGKFETIFPDTPHPFKKIIDWMIESKSFLVCVAFPFDVKREWGVLPLLKEKIFEFNNNVFSLIDEHYLLDGTEYKHFKEVDWF